MSITPRLAFDVCLENYTSIRGDMEGIPLLDPSKIPSDHVWRPSSGPRGAEYIADFALCCNSALSDPRDGDKFKLCKLFYLWLNPYEQVRKYLHLSENTWAAWTEEIRDKVGALLMQRGLFPPRSYFAERTKPKRAPRLRKTAANESQFQKRYGPSKKDLTAARLDT